MKGTLITSNIRMIRKVASSILSQDQGLHLIYVEISQWVQQMQYYDIGLATEFELTECQ